MMGLLLYLIKGEDFFDFIVLSSSFVIFTFLPNLNNLVPHVEHIPCIAGLLFFRVIVLGLFISLLVRHFIQ